MTYKTKIGIAVGIGFAFLIIMAIFMASFVKNNSGSQAKIVETGNLVSNMVNNSKNTENTANTEINKNTSSEISLNDVVSFGLKNVDDNKYSLEKISDNLNSEQIVELDKSFLSYDYSDEKIYIAYSEDGGTKISVINLSDNSFEDYTESNYEYFNSFYFCDDKIYFVTSNNSICKISKEDDSEDEFIKAKENETIVNAQIDKENKILYYMKNVTIDNKNSVNVYKYNLDNNNEEELINAEVLGQEIVVYKNYLVCNLLNESDGKDYSTNYIYNIDNNSFWELGSTKVVDYEILARGNVAFLEDYIAFSNGRIVKIVDYNGNIINENLYQISNDDEIKDIYAIGLNKLQMRIKSGETENYKAIDFKSSLVDDVSNYFYDIKSK